MLSPRVPLFLMAVCACSTLSGLAQGKAVGSESQQMNSVARSGSGVPIWDVTVLSQRRDHHRLLLWTPSPRWNQSDDAFNQLLARHRFKSMTDILFRRLLTRLQSMHKRSKEKKRKASPAKPKKKKKKKEKEDG